MFGWRGTVRCVTAAALPPNVKNRIGSVVRGSVKQYVPVAGLLLAHSCLAGLKEKDTLKRLPFLVGGQTRPTGGRNRRTTRT